MCSHIVNMENCTITPNEENDNEDSRVSDYLKKHTIFVQVMKKHMQSLDQIKNLFQKPILQKKIDVFVDLFDSKIINKNINCNNNINENIINLMMQLRGLNGGFIKALWLKLNNVSINNNPLQYGCSILLCNGYLQKEITESSVNKNNITDITNNIILLHNESIILFKVLKAAIPSFLSLYDFYDTKSWDETNC